MSTQYETVTITIAGANPQTIPVSVPVDTTTGTGTATFSYTGVNGGTDNLTGTGTIAGTGYTSNTAEVNWQTTNGTIQVGATVTGYAWGDSPTSGAVASYIWCNPSDSVALSNGATARTISTAAYTTTNNSLCFDAFTSGAGSGTSPNWAVLSSTGAVTGGLSWPPYTQNFNCCIVGYILVPAAGSYTLTLTYKDNAMWGLGPSATGAAPTWTNGTSGNYSQTMTVVKGYPLLNAPPLASGNSGVVGSGSSVVYFPQPGAYPIEVDWDYWYHSSRVCHVQANSGELAPVILISAPPAVSPSGNLTITPAGGLTNLQLSGKPITLTVNVSGVTYTTKAYCPVLEGTSGNLLLYNSASSSTYTFQTYNGQAVNKTAYATSGFQLTASDNTAYSGLFAVTYDGTNFSLNYNGGTANPNSTSRVLSSSLIITADDIAWFNSVNNSFDLFVPSGSTGGNTFNFEVDYMNKPAVASLSAGAVTANGGSYTLVIALNKAFSPQQQGAYGTGNTVNCTCSITGAASTGSPSPNIDSNGWLTGWNVPFVAPTATTNQTLTVNLSVSGQLTYLSGNAFVTNTVTYITGNVGTITATGSAYAPPTAQSLSVSPSSTAMGTTATLTATVFTATTNDSVTLTFYHQPIGGSTRYSLGVGTQTSSVSATVGSVAGYLHTFTLTFNPSSYISSSGSYLAFTAVDNVSSQTCSYTTTAVYTYTPASVSISISPSSQAIPGSATFHATVTGSSAIPTWSISVSDGSFTLSSTSGYSVTVFNNGGSFGGGTVTASILGASASAGFYNS